jgi:hypothetical protein
VEDFPVVWNSRKYSRESLLLKDFTRIDCRKAYRLLGNFVRSWPSASPTIPHIGGLYKKRSPACSSPHPAYPAYASKAANQHWLGSQEPGVFASFVLSYWEILAVAAGAPSRFPTNEAFLRH